MEYVYFLFLNNGNIYKGSTSDLKRRISEHNQGKVESTKFKRPLKLIHYEAYLMKEDATRREKYLKTTYGRRDIKRQLSSLLKHLKSQD
ncbi:MAG: GIY-YIG nuclease family protein [Patescibacteria group bacterium]